MRRADYLHRFLKLWVSACLYVAGVQKLIRCDKTFLQRSGRIWLWQIEMMELSPSHTNDGADPFWKIKAKKLLFNLIWAIVMNFSMWTSYPNSNMFVIHPYLTKNIKNPRVSIWSDQRVHSQNRPSFLNLSIIIYFNFSKIIVLMFQSVFFKKRVSLRLFFKLRLKSWFSQILIVPLFHFYPTSNQLQIS